MQQEELDAILKQKPILGILIRGVYDGKLEAITHIPPEQASETYKRYCNSIDLDYVPHLFVVDDAVGMPKGATDAAGLFIRVPAAQGIILLKSVYDGFLEDQNLAHYMTAHELGHAKFSAMHSRRFVLQQMAGLSALAGTAYGTKRTTDFLLDSALPPPKTAKKMQCANISAGFPESRWGSSSEELWTKRLCAQKNLPPMRWVARLCLR